MTDAAARVLDAAVTARAFPGAAAEVGSSDGPLWTHVAGALTYDPDAPRVTCDTRYDLASLTKVIATTSIAMRQARDETLDLDALVQRWLPAWKDGPFAAVRVRDLLEHASGLPDWRPFFKLFDPHAVPDAARAVVVDAVAAESPAYAPRSKSVYSDVGFLLLGHVIERVAGERIDVPFTRLRDEAGLPASLRYGVDSNDAVAPTEVDSWRGRLLRGEVHDENAYVLGGIAPHAGLFGTAGDVGAFARLVLQTFREETPLGVPRLMTVFATRSSVAGSSRALGWDTMLPTSSCGTRMSALAIGHTGFTGTSLWIDPAADRYYVLLTNRVHPSRENNAIRQVRRDFHEAVAS